MPRKVRRASVDPEPDVPLVPAADPHVEELRSVARSLSERLAVVFERSLLRDLEVPEEEERPKKKRPADKASALQQIRDDLGDCERCTLCFKRKKIVFGAGSVDADLMIVGEAPGEEEDLAGEPFVGPAGKMLDDMLKNVLGLERRGVYIANVVKCRPENNRDPLPDELSACSRFLARQIDVVQPKVLLVLGSIACKSLLKTTTGITRSRGMWREYGEIPAIATFHPAFLLRQPEEKPKTHSDLLELKRKLLLVQSSSMNAERRSAMASSPSSKG